ncbi:hypothetical protein B0H13DRAFT_1858873 [Mycena leptocephala]|nr:hypothetical protein B0H13DRAFT_1858873 [Mycena leptocephala]
MYIDRKLLEQLHEQIHREELHTAVPIVGGGNECSVKGYRKPILDVPGSERSRSPSGPGHRRIQQYKYLLLTPPQLIQFKPKATHTDSKVPIQVVSEANPIQTVKLKEDATGFSSLIPQTSADVGEATPIHNVKLEEDASCAEVDEAVAAVKDVKEVMSSSNCHLMFQKVAMLQATIDDRDAQIQLLRAELTQAHKLPGDTNSSLETMRTRLKRAKSERRRQTAALTKKHEELQSTCRQLIAFFEVQDSDDAPLELLRQKYLEVDQQKRVLGTAGNGKRRDMEAGAEPVPAKGSLPFVARGPIFKCYTTADELENVDTQETFPQVNPVLESTLTRYISRVTHATPNKKKEVEFSGAMKKASSGSMKDLLELEAYETEDYSTNDERKSQSEVWRDEAESATDESEDDSADGDDSTNELHKSQPMEYKVWREQAPYETDGSEDDSADGDPVSEGAEMIRNGFGASRKKSSFRRPVTPEDSDV